VRIGVDRKPFNSIPGLRPGYCGRIIVGIRFDISVASERLLSIRVAEVCFGIVGIIRVAFKSTDVWNSIV